MQMDKSESEYHAMKNALDYAIKTGREEGRTEGKAEGIAIGEALGEARRQLEIAKNLLAKGLPIPMVAETTGVNSQELEQFVV